jgi:hypothetical protein
MVRAATNESIFANGKSPAEHSRGDQGIFGSSYAEDCIFGSTASLFREPLKEAHGEKRASEDDPADNEVVSVANVQQKGTDALDNTQSSPSTKQSLGFRHLPALGRRR